MKDVKILENNENITETNEKEVSEEKAEEIAEIAEDEEQSATENIDSPEEEKEENIDEAETSEEQLEESIEEEEEIPPIEYSTEKIKELVSSFKPIDYFEFINLHIHSKYSDGKADFLDIVNQAKTLGYKKIAICDHNTVDGHKLYQDEVLIPAVEFDCWYGYVFLHLLAYGIDVNHPALQSFMAKNKKGTEADIVRIFARRNVPKLIEAIHQAGGMAVLAHPACCWALNLDKFVGKLVDLGLDGIEVYYPYRRHRAIIRFATQRQIKDIAEKYNLIPTGGTDCHNRDIAVY